MPDKTPSGAEDTTELPRAAREGLQEYANGLGPISAREMLAAYGGDTPANRHELARDLAAFKGTKEASQYRNIGKWMNRELGKPTEQRNALTNKTTQAQFRALMAAKRPPENAAIRIAGSIRYSNTARDRTVDINTPNYPVDISAMLEALAQGDTAGAYQEIFANYVPGMSVEPGADISISFF